jgi:hypothetical protein
MKVVGYLDSANEVWARVIQVLLANVKGVVLTIQNVTKIRFYCSKTNPFRNTNVGSNWLIEMPLFYESDWLFSYLRAHFVIAE